MRPLLLEGSSASVGWPRKRSFHLKWRSFIVFFMSHAHAHIFASPWPWLHTRFRQDGFRELPHPLQRVGPTGDCRHEGPSAPSLAFPCERVPAKVPGAIWRGFAFGLGRFGGWGKDSFADCLGVWFFEGCIPILGWFQREAKWTTVLG